MANAATILILLPTVASVMNSLLLIRPLRDPAKSLGDSLTYLYHLADRPLEVYREKVHNLSSKDIVDVMAQHVYEISEILRKRYDSLTRACLLLYIGVITFFAFMTAKYVWLLGWQVR